MMKGRLLDAKLKKVRILVKEMFIFSDKTMFFFFLKFSWKKMNWMREGEWMKVEGERREKSMAVFLGLKFSLCFVGDGDG